MQHDALMGSVKNTERCFEYLEVMRDGCSICSFILVFDSRFFKIENNAFAQQGIEYFFHNPCQQGLLH